MKYGPGKFEGCENYALVSQFVSTNTDEDLGDSETFGWYGKFSGKIKGHGPFYAIISENSQGFVDVEWLDTQKKLDEQWQHIERDYEHFCGPQIEDGDIKLDHIPDVSECRRLRKQFAADKYWPNVWHVNDHGNVDLLSIGYNGAKIVDSWV